jgi:hypothetical protein
LRLGLGLVLRAGAQMPVMDLVDRWVAVKERDLAQIQHQVRG